MTNRHRYARTLYGLILLLLTTACIDRQDKAHVIGEEFAIHSSILNEKRRYFIYLPASYHSETYVPRNYPVLYLLDAERHFTVAAGIAQFMAEGINGNRQIPELIIVGIPNTHRTRDLTPTNSKKTLSGQEYAPFSESGGGSAFLDFLETELMPHIESTYRISPHATFAGHSFGGLSVLYSLLERPSLHQGYIAMDPSIWWDDEFLLRRAEQVLPEDKNKQARVFIAQAGYDVSAGPFDRTDTWDRSFESLAAIVNPSNDTSRWKLKRYAKEDHASVPLRSLYDGLLHVFPDFKVNYVDLYQGPDWITDHFVRVSSSLGFEYLPPEDMIDRYAEIAYERFGDIDNALGYLKLNVANYPQSSHARERLKQFRATIDSRRSERSAN